MGLVNTTIASTTEEDRRVHKITAAVSVAFLAAVIVAIIVGTIYWNRKKRNDTQSSYSTSSQS